MPRIIHRNLRFQIIDKCLRDTHKEYHIDDIVACCNYAMMKNYGTGISKRSVQYDLNILRKPPYNIELNETLLQQGIYRYDDPYCPVQSFLYTDYDEGTSHEGPSNAPMTCVLRFSPAVIDRMETVLLSFGDGVEVVVPQWLRSRMAAHVEKMHVSYQQPSKNQNNS